MDSLNFLIMYLTCLSDSSYFSAKTFILIPSISRSFNKSRFLFDGT